MYSYKFIWFIIIILFQQSAYGGRYNETKQLIDNLMLDYNPKIRPVINQSHVVNIDVQFTISTIRDFDEVAGKLSVIGLIILHWKDELLSWQLSEYDTMSVLFPENMVWHPTMVLANPYNNAAELGEDWMDIEVKFTGDVLYNLGNIFSVSCAADVTYYPFDYQQCTLSFVPFGYTEETVSLELNSHQVQLLDYTENGEWIIQKATPFRKVELTHKRLTVGIELIIKRRSAFLLINMIIPVVLMSTMNVLVFVLPTESGERVSFAVTILLSMVVFLTIVEANLPKTSKPLSIFCFYLIFQLVTSLFMCIVNIINICIFFKSSTIKKQSCCHLLVNFINHKTKRSNDKVHPNDRVQQHQTLNKSSKCQTDIQVNKTIPDHATISDPSYEDKHEIGEDNIDKKHKVTTWQDVSRALDNISIIVFITFLTVINSTFLIILTKQYN